MESSNRKRFRSLSAALSVEEALRVYIQSEYGSVRDLGRSISLSHTSIYKAIADPGEKELRGRLSAALGFDPWRMRRHTRSASSPQ
jgi:hypothetical protein